MKSKKCLALLAATASMATSAGIAVAVNGAQQARTLPSYDLASGEDVVPLSGGDVTVQTPAAMRSRQQAFQAAVTADVGEPWMLSYDITTGVPSRLYGKGIAAPATVRSAAAAEAFARAFLAKHLDFLAPGASIDDLMLADNLLIERGHARHVGFVQHYKGMPLVAGGGVTFYFKNDRLATITSEAMPEVAVAQPSSLGAPANARASAAAWMGASLGQSLTASDVVGEPEGPLVLPLVKGSAFAPARIEYRVVYRVAVQTAKPVSGYDVFVDATTGVALARRQTTLFVSGTVGWQLGKRRASSELQFVAASNAKTSVGDTDAAGNVEVGAGGAVRLETSGRLVRIDNKAGSSVFSAEVNSVPGGQAFATAPTRDLDYAVVNTFSYLNFVFEYARALNPSLAQLNRPMTANVNLNNINCNASYTNWTTNFFQSGGQCGNTGALADVVMHEFGHGLHQFSLLSGVRFDGALSEAHGDILATTIAGRPNLGEGFFLNNPSAGLRELDPQVDKVFPRDISGQVHTDGEVYGGTMWDLRKALVAKLGEAAGVARFNQIWYDSMRRANNMQTADVHIFEADDDDGDVTNGTPNACEIAATLEAHGLLLTVGNTPTSPTIRTPSLDGMTVAFDVETPNSDCVVAQVQSASLRWKVRGDDSDAGNVAMTATATGYKAVLPAKSSGTVLNYQIVVELTDGNTTTWPRNAADPWYEMYVGPVEEVYCARMDTDPGFTTGGTGVSWQYGPAVASGDDPAAAYTGTNIFGQNLGLPYTASAESWAEVKVDGLEGRENLHLQYRRWLNVEDGNFDQATISINGKNAWSNLNSAQGDNSNVHHKDGEWRFHDIALAPYLDGSGSATIRFSLTSDAGLEFGGWNLDDVCVVAMATGPVCGNGEVEETEQCDDSNTADGDGCSASCQTEGVDEDTDEDTDTDTGNESPADGDDAGGCGCRAGSDPSQTGAAIFLMLGVIAILRRRRC